jgi:hypothetical protein
MNEGVGGVDVPKALFYIFLQVAKTGYRSDSSLCLTVLEIRNRKIGVILI